MNLRMTKQNLYPEVVVLVVAMNKNLDNLEKKRLEG
jgi:hypothetical protein